MPRTVPAAKVAKKELNHLKRCMCDHPYYAVNHLKIVPFEGGIVPLDFNFPQSVVHEIAAKQKAERGFVRIIILKARQEGLSTYVSSRGFRKVQLWHYMKGLVIAHKQKATGVLFKMYERYLANLDDTIRVDKVANERGNYLEFINGSILSVETAGDPEAARSQTNHFVHASEIAFWPNAEQVWNAVDETVPQFGSEVFIESTANGVGNYFHTLWEAAERGDNDFIAIFLPWFIYDKYQTPVTDEQRLEIVGSSDPYEREAQDDGFEFMGEMVKLTPEQLWWRRRKIANKGGTAEAKRKFRQEFPTTAREAFIVSGDGFFDSDALEAIEADITEPIARGSFVPHKEGFRFQRGEFGALRVWEMPKPDAFYVIGADTAGGKSKGTLEDEEATGGRDFSVADVFDVKTRTQVAQLHGRMPPEVFAKQLNWLGYFYAQRGPAGASLPAILAPERNHDSGHTVIKKLQREHNYPAIYFARTMNVRTRKVTPVAGWVTNAMTRRTMLDELAEAVHAYIERDDPTVMAKAITVNSERTLRELFTFITVIGPNGKEKPQAQEGAHDDTVISLAITLQIAQNFQAPTKSGFAQDEETPDTPTGAVDFGY